MSACKEKYKNKSKKTCKHCHKCDTLCLERKNKVQSIRERIAKMKNRRSSPKVTYAKYQKFPDATREKAKKTGLGLKRLVLVLAVVGCSVVHAGFNNSEPSSITVKVMQDTDIQKKVMCNNIQEIVEFKTENLQKDILSNVDSLQRWIIQAQKTGTKNKNKVVKKILDEVFPRGGLPGSTHYCVAGAAKARLMCNDSTLNAIMPDPAKLPKEYGFASSPNVSCPFMRQYFKNTLGENYAQRGDNNFNAVVNSLEAGDIITLKSSRNTSSGEHCVTVAGPLQEDGTIPVKSLNTEDNYNIYPKQIVGAAKLIAQYRKELTNYLTAEYEKSYELFGLERKLADAKDISSSSKVYASRMLAKAGRL